MIENKIKQMSGSHSVSIIIEYSDSEGLWYGEIISASMLESREFKRVSCLETLLNYMENHLDNPSLEDMKDQAQIDRAETLKDRLYDEY